MSLFHQLKIYPVTYDTDSLAYLEHFERKPKLINIISVQTEYVKVIIYLFIYLRTEFYIHYLSSCFILSYLKDTEVKFQIPLLWTLSGQCCDNNWR